jgi:GrpB-like predicted nucleotidyltransferase (UPF0157 family)
MTSNRIEIAPYNPRWPELFASEAEQIKQALGNNCIAIHHIGSTSVPGLSAKPIIDILPVVKEIQEVDLATHAMESLGYQAKGEYGIAFRRYFQKEITRRTHNVHVYQEGDPEISRYLKFRDWLRSHPEDAVSYAKLKTELATQYPHDILRYCNGKDAFVATIDAKGGAEGWRMVQALTDREWSAVRHLRGHSESPAPLEKDHIHFVFYKNTEIIGYVDLQLQAPQALLHLLIIDAPHRNQGFGTQLLHLSERWLRHQSIRTLYVPNKFPSKHSYAHTNHPQGFTLAKHL